MKMETEIAKDSIIIRGEHFVPYISEMRIQHRVKEIASGVDARVGTSRPVAVCALSGAVIFYADLLRAMETDCDMAFIKISSYGNKKITSEQVKLEVDFTHDLTGRDVIIVEDIVDTGISIEYLRQRLEEKQVKSVTVVALLSKPEARKVDSIIDFVGFEIENEFVVGYGLDYAQEARALRDIYIRETERSTTP